MNPVQLIVFDLGGVLIQITHSWEQACQRAGYDPKQLAPSKPGIDLDLQDLWKAHETGQLASDEVYTKAGRLLDMPAQAVADITLAWLIGPYPGVVELLTELQKQKTPTACLSNTNPHHWQFMTAPTGPVALPLHLLTHRFASQMIGYAKPAPAVFDHVEKQTGIDRANILFFDDAQPNIVAARRRGWQVVQVDSDGDTVMQIRRELAGRGLLPM